MFLSLASNGGALGTYFEKVIPMKSSISEISLKELWLLAQPVLRNNPFVDVPSDSWLTTVVELADVLASSRR